MKEHKFEILLAATLLALYASFYLWQTPGLIQGKLTAAEVDGYVAALERNMAVPPEVMQGFVADLRAWGNADDGQPIYMLNLLRYHDALERWPGGPTFPDAPTPAQANALYERKLTPLALSSGDYPIFIGTSQGRNLIDHEPAVDNWSRIVVMRYPSRRAFLELVSDPTLGRLFAYKYAAEDIALVPTTANLVVSDLRLLVGAALLIVCLLVCSLHARGGHRRAASERGLLRERATGVEPATSSLGMR